MHTHSSSPAAVLVVALILAGCGPCGTGTTPGIDYATSQWFTERGQIGRNGDAKDSDCCTFPLKERWQKTLPSTIVGIGGEPIGGNGLIFTAHGKKLYALNPIDGAELWTYTAPDYIFGTPTYTEEDKGTTKRVFFTDRVGTLYALDASTGAVLWHNATPQAGYVSSPNISHGVLYYTAELEPTYENSIVRAIDGSSGAVRFERTFDGYQTTGESSPLLGSGKIVLEFRPTGADPSNQGVWALQAGTGVPLWKIPTGQAWAQVFITEIVDYNVGMGNPMRYITGTGQANTTAVTAYAYNYQTGAPIWATVLEPGASVARRVIGLALTQDRATDALIFQTTTRLYSLDKNTGSVLWSVPAVTAGETYRTHLPGPIIWGNYVFAVLNSVPSPSIRAFRLSDGVETWTLPVSAMAPGSTGSAQPYASFSVVGHTLYFKDQMNILHAYSP